MKWAMECYPKLVDHWPTMNAHAGFLRQQMDTNGPSMSHVAVLQTHLLGQRANQITVGNHYLPQKLQVDHNMQHAYIYNQSNASFGNDPLNKNVKNPPGHLSSVQQLRGSARSSARAKQPAC